VYFTGLGLVGMLVESYVNCAGGGTRRQPGAALCNWSGFVHFLYWSVVGLVELFGCGGLVGSSVRYSCTLVFVNELMSLT
jgi:hypothetical protein